MRIRADHFPGFLADLSEGYSSARTCISMLSAKPHYWVILRSYRGYVGLLKGYVEVIQWLYKSSTGLYRGNKGL